MLINDDDMISLSRISHSVRVSVGPCVFVVLWAADVPYISCRTVTTTACLWIIRRRQISPACQMVWVLFVDFVPFLILDMTEVNLMKAWEKCSLISVTTFTDVDSFNNSVKFTEVILSIIVAHFKSNQIKFIKSRRTRWSLTPPNIIQIVCSKNKWHST